MDLNDFWQENKRFVLTVAGGLLAFLIGVVVINSVYGADLAVMKRRLAKAESGLSKPMFKPGDLTRAQDENDALQAALSEVTEAVDFRARPQFELGDGKATNRYFAVVSEVREDLMARAGRAGLSVPEDLGLPQLSPSNDLQIERYLEALDHRRSLRAHGDRGRGHARGRDHRSSSTRGCSPVAASTAWSAPKSRCASRGRRNPWWRSSY